MAIVSEQVTDAVTQSNVKVIGEAPAMAMATVFQTMSHSTGLMFENSVNVQNQQNILGQTATTMGVMQIYSLDTISDAVAIARILKAG
jgi:Killing trait